MLNIPCNTLLWTPCRRLDMAFFVVAKSCTEHRNGICHYATDKFDSAGIPIPNWSASFVRLDNDGDRILVGGKYEACIVTREEMLILQCSGEA